jgi:olfactory receptor
MVLRLPSSNGKDKAFFTCESHLSVVCLYFGTGFGEYVGSAILPSPRNSEVVSVMYPVVTPLLNPFIYSLRNTEIKTALRCLYNRIV